jgi:hypothetical protein
MSVALVIAEEYVFTVARFYAGPVFHGLLNRRYGRVFNVLKGYLKVIEQSIQFCRPSH